MLIVLIVNCGCQVKYSKWVKFENNPILGGEKLGPVFDCCVLQGTDSFRMYFSWRDKSSIGLCSSSDGLQFTNPRIVLPPQKEGLRVNRPVIVKRDSCYMMWFTCQSPDSSYISYAFSIDGYEWTSDYKPILKSYYEWENSSLMCPHVIFDNKEGIYKMWYSGGGQSEPDAIGYAISRDGKKWTKYNHNPIYIPDKSSNWDNIKVSGCQVIKRDNDYLMFYIGFCDNHTAAIGIAKSRDGITNWARYEGNPIIEPSFFSWDKDAVYKPWALYDNQNNRWLVYYNGRSGVMEQIGIAYCLSTDIGY